MNRDLSKHYDKLTNQERFKLTLALMAAGDNYEADRVVFSAERKVYSMTDSELTDPLDKTCELTHLIIEGVERFLVAEALLQEIVLAMEMTAFECGHTEPPERVEKLMDANFRRAERVKKEAYALKAGTQSFLAQIGLTMNEMLVAPGNLQAMRKAYPNTVPFLLDGQLGDYGQDVAASFSRMLADFWGLEDHA